MNNKDLEQLKERVRQEGFFSLLPWTHPREDLYKALERLESINSRVIELIQKFTRLRSDDEQ